MASKQPSFDSSVGRAVDCSGADIHRSLVRIRLEGCFLERIFLAISNELYHKDLEILEQIN